MAANHGVFFHPPQPLSSPTTPAFTPSRKRRAASPTLDSDPLSSWHQSGPPASFTDTPHREKRRRPNLANGFSSLSISPTATQSPAVPDQPRADDDDEGIGPSVYPRNDDVKVEILSDNTNRLSDHQHPFHRTHAPQWDPYHARLSSSSSSASPTTSTDETYDSDAIFTRNHPRIKRYDGTAQQADEIVQPDGSSMFTGPDLSVEDVTGVLPPLRARRPREEDAEVMEHAGKKRRVSEMDIDMSTMDGNTEDASIEEKDKLRGRKTVWYEPEKDRIVITSLSDSDSRSSRSPSPETDSRYLSQPGEQGFTISPSLLTHLMNAQRNNDLKGPLQDLLKNNQKSLTLYRPLGIPADRWKESIVKTWEDAQNYDDSGRFEEIDDSEDFGNNTPATGNDDVAMGMEGTVPAWQPDAWNMGEAGMGGSGAVSGDGDVDMAMDVE
ncbi:hypothetical protein I309_06436 [Cryptococcus deuterogattii LA55]|nr:hypothetical protein I309_06436 [Cryptococcus deuterogattii LA55]KIR91195.1 hypothetical protein I304_04662 [Cryptococcus deuterogattii CBS 10090]